MYCLPKSDNVMSCHCTKIYNFKDPLQSCDQSSFADLFSGLADGNYTLQIDFLDTAQFVSMVKDGSITFPNGLVLNENFTYIAKIVGTPLVFGGISYDCFQFTTLNYSAFSDSNCGGSCIEDIISGTNITIDKTNPKKPIINSTADGAEINRVFSTEYEATGGEVDFTLSELIGARLILIIKEIQPLKIAQRSLNSVDGKVTLTSVDVQPLETFYITYSKITP